MLAPNPLSPKPPRLLPWETPADLSPYIVRSYGHIVALELGMRQARRHFTAAENIFASPVNAMVWAAGVLPFTNFSEAARFVIETGKSTQSQKTTATIIRRACARGVPRYGISWKPRRSPTTEPKLETPAMRGIASELASLPASVARIIHAVAVAYEVSPEAIIGRRRHEVVTLPRQVCMYLARSRTRYNLVAIGGFLGGRDHTTVKYGCEVVVRRIRSDPAFAAQVGRIESTLEAAETQATN